MELRSCPQEPPHNHLNNVPPAAAKSLSAAGLRIGASTVSIEELLRNDWTGVISADLAWLVLLQGERRLTPFSP
jgi:hypothetical protein